MSMIYAEIGIENASTKRRIDARAQVNPSSVYFTVPAHMARQLGFSLEETSTREVILADGTRKAVPMIGPVRVYFADRHCSLSALVLGDEPLLGRVLMDMMDLVLNATTQTLTVNPENPFVPVALAK